MTIYQTAFDRDRFGYRFVGFQFSQDPGEPVVWAASILLIAGLLIAFFIPCRTLGGARIDDEVLLVGLSGFRGEAGRQVFNRLEMQLTDRMNEKKSSLP